MKASLFDTYRLIVKAKAKGKPECDIPRLSKEELSQVGAVIKGEVVKAEAEENARKLRLVPPVSVESKQRVEGFLPTERPTDPLNPKPRNPSEPEEEPDPETLGDDEDGDEEDLEGEEDFDSEDSEKGEN